MATQLDGIRAKAIELRKAGLSLADICDRLKMSKSTVYGWIRGERIPVTDKQRKSARAAGVATKQKHAEIRRLAYEQGAAEYIAKVQEPMFREFVMLYLTEGYRKTRNQVAVSNGNPNLMRLAMFWIRRLKNPARPIEVSVAVHKDNEDSDIREFWSNELGVASATIKIRMKTNSGGLSGRNYRNDSGVCMVLVSDTYFRARLEAWMVLLQKEWQGVAQSG